MTCAHVWFRTRDLLLVMTSFFWSFFSERCRTRKRMVIKMIQWVQLFNNYSRFSQACNILSLFSNRANVCTWKLSHVIKNDHLALIHRHRRYTSLFYPWNRESGLFPLNPENRRKRIMKEGIFMALLHPGFLITSVISASIHPGWCLEPIDLSHATNYTFQLYSCSSVIQESFFEFWCL